MEEIKQQSKEERKEGQTKEKIQKPKINLNNYLHLKSLISDFKDDPQSIRPIITNHIEKMIIDSKLKERYKILFIYDEKSNINDLTLDRLQPFLSETSRDNDVLVILHSKGGEIEKAYIISKCFQECFGKFIVVIPRNAKSAATLLALGADEIHMGNMSELGPIDPQIKDLPALTLKDAIKYLSSLLRKYPEASDMFAKFLIEKLDLQNLGHFIRIPEAAKDYATRLLIKKRVPEDEAKVIAKKFVYEYKYHGFVIDKDEARSLLGEVIKISTEEYRLAEKIHKFLGKFSLALRVTLGDKYRVSLVGDIKSGFMIFKI